MKTILIKQPKGLGDIFFCQKIARKFLEDGHQVLWPVADKYLANVLNYIEGPIFFKESDNFPFKHEYNSTHRATIQSFDNCTVVATDGCAATKDYCGVMVNKYKLVNLEYKDWLNYFHFTRNFDKEAALFNQLELKENEKYIITNKNIGGIGSESSWDIPIPSGIRVIETREIDGFSVFDWCKVFEYATEFHIMETWLSYIIEKIPTRQTEYIMYHRSPSDSPNYRELTTIYAKPKKHISSEFIKRLC